LRIGFIPNYLRGHGPELNNKFGSRHAAPLSALFGSGAFVSSMKEALDRRVEDRNEEKRECSGDDHAANDDARERGLHLGAAADPQRQRYQRKHRSGGGHDYRPQPQTARVRHGFVNGHAFPAQLVYEVD